MKNEVERIEILPDLSGEVFDQDPMLFEFVDDRALLVGLAPFSLEII